MFVFGAFCRWDVLRLGSFFSWDVLYLGPSVLGRFVFGTF
jgi:hypothetical protein